MNPLPHSKSDITTATNHQSMDPLPPPRSDSTTAATPRQTPLWKKRKVLVKELSLNEKPRYVAWERRRRLKRNQEKKDDNAGTDDELSEDLNELKGCLQLGFGFNDDEGGQSLTNTLPALDIYFAVNRLGSPMVSPSGNTSPVPKFERSMSKSASFNGHINNRATFEDSWKICTPGETPQQVKAKLRHWAQAVACSMISS
ncbi:hypothetical protein OSB04_008647 [Centaurea solstitialis]|uniref:Uncharacterized protein n=1 Tax=Centaurea solstitialis TaxID=347529 RepID=A0AA38U5I3_9ASTR|nr:hypothetical protein OSB04_008647 [Centaurea solstitialis]